MKKRSVWLAALMAMLVFCASAHAASVTDLLKGYGLSEADAKTVEKLVESMGDNVTEEELRALLSQFIADPTSKKPGSTSGDIYTNPVGFSFRVPAGWAIREDQIGMNVMLVGPQNENKFSPTIGVAVFSEIRPDFDTNTQADWDAVLSQSLDNYQFVALDNFTFLDVQAHEFICMHGESENSMLAQYQMFFNKDGRAFVITMTTVAEEVSLDQTLEIYDNFMSEFQVLAAQAGIG